ncbi:MAG: magnesium/cobalt efflux protein [Gammaproteobacteria bacterium CG_4_10_14_0_8_um_filter_38_16]|nr:MAG: magnesium/cobalt efflux protein [Gammaproteobacteria bacterium CG_4_10_14_0_8_um_filter_38_16]PJA03298.1 MAG: magnesium/cobalt efflux protein [Gammaproteobacteria bacterium CG_4_10_14_0_2_um_filter_38_22]PJB10343.1 MAG: magnesium/cobalt efflux protein [Gammaproteobacteria bacterium CG_4_9_14_3_um_filter_38_9]
MFIAILIFLILLAAFFSAAETSMMAVNRYRLRHLSKKSDKRATRVLKLLERPDRVLGVTLMGNTFAEILASAVATVVTVKWFGETGALISAVLLTVIVLIFGEIAPKTLAALHAQRIAFRAVTPLTWLLKILYPFVWFVSAIANGALRIFGVRADQCLHESLSIDELRSIVREVAGKTSSKYQELLLRVLDLQQITVEEVMVPKNEIDGIDLEADWNTIVTRILQSSHAYLPLYREEINKTQGMLCMREVLVKLYEGRLDKTALLHCAHEVHFIPQGAFLHQQLLNFQRENQAVGLVVDEYGDIQGILMLRDVLEEIAGDFVMDPLEMEQLISVQEDESVLVDASISLRDLNRLMHWHLPVRGARTLSGLMIAYLESIPKTILCARIAGFPMEVISVSENTIVQVRIWPTLYRSSATE